MGRTGDNVEHMGILVGASLVKTVSIEDSCAAFFNQGYRGRIGNVIQFGYGILDSLISGRRDMHLIAQYSADCGNRYIGFFGYILDCCCHLRSSIGKTFA